MKYKVKILRMLTRVMALWGMLAMCLLYSLQVCAVSANTVGDSGTPADQDGITGIFDENTINQTTLFDHLDIRIDNLPDISIDNPDGYSYNLYDTTRGDYVYRVINFPDLPDDQWADMKITASFPDSVTINGRKASMKIVYSDFYPYSSYNVGQFLGVGGATDGFLAWSAYGAKENQSDANEWFYAFPAASLDLYFYWDGVDTPINIYRGYFTLYSLDGYMDDQFAGQSFYQFAEGTGSNNATSTYVYPDTYIKYLKSMTLGDRTINNVYYGTMAHETNRDDRTAVTFEYVNQDHMNFNLYALNGQSAPGYHLDFTGLGYNVDFDKLLTKKEASEGAVYPGDKIEFTISQQFPATERDAFRLTSVVLVDELDSRLQFESVVVYDENGNNVTERAGEAKLGADNKLTFTFSPAYLDDIECNGQVYKLVLTAKVKEDAVSGDLANSAYAIFDYYNTSTSKDVNIMIQELPGQPDQPDQSVPSDDGQAHPGVPSAGIFQNGVSGDGIARIILRGATVALSAVAVVLLLRKKFAKTTRQL